MSSPTARIRLHLAGRRQGLRRDRDNNEFHDVDIFDITDPRAPDSIADHDLFESVPQSVDSRRQRQRRQVFLHDMVVKRIGGEPIMLGLLLGRGLRQARRRRPGQPDDHRRLRVRDPTRSPGGPARGQRPPGGVHATTTSTCWPPTRTSLPTGDPHHHGDAGRDPGDRRRLLVPLATGSRTRHSRVRSSTAATEATRSDRSRDALRPQPPREPRRGGRRGRARPRSPPDEDYDGDGKHNDADDACFPGQGRQRRGRRLQGLVIINRRGATASDAYSPADCGSTGDLLQGAVPRVHDPQAGSTSSLHGRPRRTRTTRPGDAPRSARSRREVSRSPACSTAGATRACSTATEGRPGGARWSASTAGTSRSRSAHRRSTPAGFGDLPVHEFATDPTEPSVRRVLRGGPARDRVRARQEHSSQEARSSTRAATTSGAWSTSPPTTISA